jgi:hypothetical protein
MVIVVDDGSSDATAQIAAEAGAIVFSHEHNGGKGTALRTAFGIARDYAPDAVVMLDGLSGEKVTDSQSGYRAFSPRALERISLHSRGFSVESEMQFLAHEQGLKLVEVPVTVRYPDRPKRPVWTHGLLVLNGLLRLVGQHRPLLFFGLPGALLLAGGFGMGAVVVRIYEVSKQLAVGYALVTLLLTILGTLSLFTGLTLHSVRGLLVDMLKTDHGK